MVFPYTSLGVKVELYYSGTWNDITSYVRLDDAGIKIGRGMADEAGSPDPSYCWLALNNIDGRFSPRNPRSPLYGLIGRNTKIRVRVIEGVDTFPRFYGEVASWPPRWEMSGADVWVPIAANGVTRRLQAGATPVKSALRRAEEIAPNMIGYWPCEDEAGATTLASGLTGGPPLELSSGSSDIASSAALASSAPLPVLATGWWQVDVPPYTGTGETQVRWVAAVDQLPSLDCQLVTLSMTGTIVRWTVVLPSAGGDLIVRAYDSDGVRVLNSTVSGSNPLDKNVRCSLELLQVGADIEWDLYVYFEDAAATHGFGTLSGYTAGRVGRISVADPNGIGSVGFGHLSLQTDITSIFDMQDVFNAYVGEAASTRAVRLCTENGVASTLNAGTDTTNACLMGKQRVRKLTELLDEIRALGLRVHDDRAQFGLVIDTFEYRQDQNQALNITYGKATQPFEPVEDDEPLANDVTVSRENGGSARVVIESGALGTAGIGTYPSQVSLNLAEDGQAIYHAAWRAGKGTHDEARYPNLTFDLMELSERDSNLLGQLALTDISKVIKLTDPPSWLPGGPVYLMVEGYTEILGSWQWEITYNCVPAEPWNAWVVESTSRGHIDTDGSTTATASFVVGTSTSLSVNYSGTRWVRAADQAAALPFQIMVDGVVLNVTAVAGTSSPQTFTVDAVPLNGVYKTITSGKAVNIYRPARVGI